MHDDDTSTEQDEEQRDEGAPLLADDPIYSSDLVGESGGCLHSLAELAQSIGEFLGSFFGHV